MYVRCDQLFICFLTPSELEGGKFHMHPTAQAQNTVPRIFALPTNAQTDSLIYESSLLGIIIVIVTTRTL